MALSDLLQGCPDKLDNRNVTRWTTQGCNKSDNINKVVTSSSQLVPNLLTIWDKQCEHNLLADLQQDVRFLRV